MFIALNENNEPVTVDEAKRGQAYYCPVCQSKVTFKAGHVRIPHFSHYRIAHCIRYLYKSESIEHLKAKHDLYLHIKQSRNVDMEIYLDEIEQIPDLLADKTAIEIQLSTISIDLLLTRTRGYTSLGMDVYWLLDEHAFNPHKPTQFQLATMKSHHLFTYDIDAACTYMYRMIYFDGFNWHFERSVIDASMIDEVIEDWPQKFYRIPDGHVKGLVTRAKSNRSVLDLTLGSLYRLGWQVEDIPEWMGVVTPSERWILNSTLEWKLYVYLNVLDGTFEFDTFLEILVCRPISDAPVKEALAKALMEEYYMLNTSHNISELVIIN